jgi:GT2 family glycosyltransferase
MKVKNNSKKPLVSVVIVTLNNIDWLKKSLKNLYAQNYKNIEVFVVDNGSSDGTIKELGIKFKKVKLINSGGNIGFGRAANLAIKKCKGKYIFIYNDDAFLEKDTLSLLVEKLEKDITVAAVQGTILFNDRRRVVESAGAFLTNTGVLEKREGFLINKNLKETEVFNANLPLIRREVLREVGLFDNDYFLYFEEADLEWRIWLAGYRVIYYPKAQLYHARGVTTKNTPKPRILESTYANRIDSLIKNLELKNLLWILPSNLVICLAGILLFLLKGKPRESFAIFKGTFSFLFKLKSILIKRRKIQSVRRITDKELFNKIFKFISLKVLLKGAGDYFKSW